MRNLKHLTMKKILNSKIAGVIVIFITSCVPQADKIGEIGPPPANGKITVDATDQYNPKFTASADRGFIYQWDLGNNQTTLGQTVTSYFPFSGSYNISCAIFGEGAQKVDAATTFVVATTDPTITNKPGWKELTGGGAGRTWVYNTDPATGTPDYCFQTYFDLVAYPENWKPQNSWGQCVRITPDINGEMVFDLNGGINYTYHQTAGDDGTKGTFILDVANMKITIVNPYILDHAIDCTASAVTATGAYDIKLLTDDEMVLWQNQGDGTGWSWSFKRKGYNP
jgi:hypothetical protein